MRELDRDEGLRRRSRRRTGMRTGHRRSDGRYFASTDSPPESILQALGEIDLKRFREDVDAYVDPAPRPDLALNLIRGLARYVGGNRARARSRSSRLSPRTAPSRRLTLGRARQLVQRLPPVTWCEPVGARECCRRSRGLRRALAVRFRLCAGLWSNLRWGRRPRGARPGRARSVDLMIAATALAPSRCPSTRSTPRTCGASRSSVEIIDLS